jgi:hypothetical protein
LELLGFNLCSKEISVNQVQEKKKRKEKKGCIGLLEEQKKLL